MVIKSKTTGSSTNPLKFTEIEEEFGINSSGTTNPGRRSLGNYRVSQSFGELTNLPLDTGIQQNTSNTDKISFSDFYDKQANIIVDCYTSGNETCNHDAYTDRFAANKFDVVGRFKTNLPKSDWNNGKKVIIHVNKTFGSKNATSRNDVALKVGDISNTLTNAWPTTTTLSVNIGTQGLVVGKGGDGGRGGYGGNESLVPGDGEPGSSGLKRHSGMSITGETRIRGGGGGGGGGLGVSSLNENDDEPAVRCFGGGGGGGAGVPNGEGGISGNNVGNLPGVSGLVNGMHPDARHGAAGDDSNNTVGGSGGLGAAQVTDTDESGDTQPGALCTMGRGGDGGSVQNNGNGSDGGDGSDNIIGPHWVDDTPTGFGEGGLGGLRYITY